MLHSPDPRTMLKDQDFPISLEIQLLGGLGTGPRTTANLCTPGSHVVYNGRLHTAHCTNSTSRTYDGDQWVRVEVLVHGDELVRHIVEGQTVLEYSKPQIGGGAVDAGRSRREGRRHADDRRLHRAPGGDGADRFPEGRAAQPRRLQRPAGTELQVLHREVEPGAVPLACWTPGPGPRRRWCLSRSSRRAVPPIDRKSTRRRPRAAAALYAEHCINCHGSTAKGGPNGPGSDSLDRRAARSARQRASARRCARRRPRIRPR